MAKQESLVPKTPQEVKESFEAFKNSIAPLSRLPKKTSDAVRVMQDFSPEQLEEIRGLCKAVTPVLRMVAQLAAEI